MHEWCLPCITNAFASGRAPGNARKYARNEKNGPVNDKTEISRSSLEAQKQQDRAQ